MFQAISEDILVCSLLIPGTLYRHRDFATTALYRLYHYHYSYLLILSYLLNCVQVMVAQIVPRVLPPNMPPPAAPSTKTASNDVENVLSRKPLAAGKIQSDKLSMSESAVGVSEGHCPDPTIQTGIAKLSSFDFIVSEPDG